MSLKIILYIIVCMIIYSTFITPNEVTANEVTANENENEINYLGADGHIITLKNNVNATDPTYDELISFIKKDDTNWNKYNEIYKCGDYAEDLHNNAELAGIKSGFVAIYFKFGMNNDLHACNVFNTTDKGLIYIDCTGGDTVVNIVEGENYIPEPFNPRVIYDSMGVVRKIEMYW